MPVIRPETINCLPSSFDHNYMVPMRTLHLRILRVRRRTWLKLVRSFLERGIQRASCFPP